MNALFIPLFVALCITVVVFVVSGRPDWHHMAIISFAYILTRHIMDVFFTRDNIDYNSVKKHVHRDYCARYLNKLEDYISDDKIGRKPMRLAIIDVEYALLQIINCCKEGDETIDQLKRLRSTIQNFKGQLIGTGNVEMIKSNINQEVHVLKNFLEYF